MRARLRADGTAVKYESEVRTVEALGAGGTTIRNQAAVRSDAAAQHERNDGSEPENDDSLAAWLRRRDARLRAALAAPHKSDVLMIS